MAVDRPGSIWPERRYFQFCLAASAFLFLVCAVFSAGTHDPDEYFQIVEFTSTKLSITDTADLTWEYREQMRPWLQPAIYVGVARTAAHFGIHRPLTLLFLFRLADGGHRMVVALDAGGRGPPLVRRRSRSPSSLFRCCVPLAFAIPWGAHLRRDVRHRRAVFRHRAAGMAHRHVASRRQVRLLRCSPEWRSGYASTFVTRAASWRQAPGSGICARRKSGLRFLWGWCSERCWPWFPASSPIGGATGA